MQKEYNQSIIKPTMISLVNWKWLMNLKIRLNLKSINAALDEIRLLKGDDEYVKILKRKLGSTK